MTGSAGEQHSIAKLEWAKLGESERQLRDAASILAVPRALTHAAVGVASRPPSTTAPLTRLTPGGI